jgi:hypothetical protein
MTTQHKKGDKLSQASFIVLDSLLVSEVMYAD